MQREESYLCICAMRMSVLLPTNDVSQQSRKGNSKLLTVIARLTDMWMGDICFCRCDADIVILFIEFLGMWPSHVFAAVIVVCRYVEINDTFLFG